jgi:GDPmannose 4,6-dehydratase
MSRKVALVSGITGQDGSYLAEYLLTMGYQVHGIRRRSSSFNTGRIDHLLSNNDFHLHYGDITDYSSINSIFNKVKPSEFYNLAAQSHVAVSFETPEYTGHVDALGTLRVLEIVKSFEKNFKCRVYQASTSELYGVNSNTPQNEISIFAPVSPYSIAKLYAYKMCELYRNSMNIFVSNGILFNHESPRRGETFLTRKVSMAVARILQGSDEKLLVGNLHAIRDWGHAKDFVLGMWAILQHDSPDDFVLATGIGHTVQEFISSAFKVAGIELEWIGEPLGEKAIDRKNGKILVEVDKGYFRPAEVPKLIGDYTKAKNILNWSPKIKFEQLVQEMVEFDIERIRNK